MSDSEKFLHDIFFIAWEAFRVFIIVGSILVWLDIL